MNYFFIRDLANSLYLRWDERVLVFTDVEKAKDCILLINAETEFDMADAVITEETLKKTLDETFWLDPVLKFEEEENENNI